MKLIVSILAVFLLANTCLSQSITEHDQTLRNLNTEHEYAEKYGLKRVAQYIFKDKDNLADSVLFMEKRYNENYCILLQKMHYAFSKEKESNLITYKYAEDGRIAEIKTTFSDENNFVLMYKFKHSETDSIVELYYDYGYENSLELEKYIYSFYEDGRFKGKQFNTAVFSNIYYNYNDQKQLINVSYVENDNAEHFKYDKKGRIVLKRLGEVAKIQFKFDEHDNVIEEYAIDEHGKVKHHNKLEYSYDDKGNAIEVKVFSGNGKLEHIKQYTYNEKGLTTSYTLLNKKGKFEHLSRYYYTYQ